MANSAVEHLKLDGSLRPELLLARFRHLREPHRRAGEVTQCVRERGYVLRVVRALVVFLPEGKGGVARKKKPSVFACVRAKTEG